MLYTELNVNGEIFKLRLNTRTSISLEKALGRNPISVLMDLDEGTMPKLNDIVIMLQAMLQTYHHGYNLDKTIDLFDDYIAGGKTMFDIIPVFVEVFEQSGYISKTANANSEDEKN